MRVPLTLLMLFASVACLLLLPPAAARAEVIYYTEDFKNGDTPGFDPMFNHEFDGSGWAVAWNTPPRDPSTCVLLLPGSTTTDSITFNLPDSARIVYASVEPMSTFTWWFHTVRFFGTEGTWVTGPDDYGKSLIEVTSAEIGYIERIELYAEQDGYMAVTIGVVPEPSSITLLGILASVALFARCAALWRK